MEIVLIVSGVVVLVGSVSLSTWSEEKKKNQTNKNQ